MKVNLKDVKSFIEGNWNYYKSKIKAAPNYITEQVEYRLFMCKDDCLVTNKCKECSCPPKKKGWVVKSCNNGERFPDLMNKDNWESFKQRNNIEIKDND